MHDAFDEGYHEDIVFTGKQKLVLVLFALTFVIMIISVIPWGNFNITWFDHTSFLTGNNLGSWWFSDLSTWFLAMSVIIGVIYGVREPEIVRSFLNGASDMIGVALVIGVSRGISVIMASSGLDVYVLTHASTALEGVNSVLFTGLAFVVYLGLAFLIPSTSGLATVSIPIFGTLASKLGLPPEVMILVLSGACALVNSTCPTSGALMGGLGIAKLEYSTWVKFIWKIALMMIVADIIILSCAMLIL